MSGYAKTKSEFIKLVYFHKEKTELIKNEDSFWEYVWKKIPKTGYNIIHYNIEAIDSIYTIYSAPREFIVLSTRSGDTYFVDIDYKKIIQNSLGYEIS